MLENVAGHETVEGSFCKLGACENDVDVADDHSIEDAHGLHRQFRGPLYPDNGCILALFQRGTERSARATEIQDATSGAGDVCLQVRPSRLVTGGARLANGGLAGCARSAAHRSSVSAMRPPRGATTPCVRGRYPCAMGSDELQSGQQAVARQPHRDGDPSLRGGIAADYLELLKRSLTATVHQDVYTCSTTFDRPNLRKTPWAPRRWAAYLVASAVALRQWELVKRCEHEALEQGRAWPLVGETMVGKARLDNLQNCIEDVVRQSVPGDYIETGVWRGGASIFARGVMKALGVDDRRVWVADSFAGLPRPDGRYKADADDITYSIVELAIPLEVVKENFRRYGLLDDQVRFLPGWFRDTLPTLGDQSWAVLRLDGDMYGSTMDALENLYPRLSPGGYVIVDDGALPACRAAVDDFRSRHHIQDPIEQIDWTGCFWQRGPASQAP